MHDEIAQDAVAASCAVASSTTDRLDIVQRAKHETFRRPARVGAATGPGRAALRDPSRAEARADGRNSLSKSEDTDREIASANAFGRVRAAVSGPARALPRGAPGRGFRAGERAGRRSDARPRVRPPPDRIKREKGVWWMPWRQEAMKDAALCDKPGGGESTP